MLRWFSPRGPPFASYIIYHDNNGGSTQDIHYVFFPTWFIHPVDGREVHPSHHCHARQELPSRGSRPCVFEASHPFLMFSPFLKFLARVVVLLLHPLPPCRRSARCSISASPRLSSLSTSQASAFSAVSPAGLFKRNKSLNIKTPYPVYDSRDCSQVR